MRGSSAESLATLTTALEGAADDGANARKLGDDLFAVSEVLRAEPGLRRVVTDVSLRGEAKSGMFRELFADQLDEPALDIAGQAVELRWVATRDLGDALEHLGVVAMVKAADKDKKGDQLEDELFAFGRLVADNPDLRDALSDPARSVDDKRQLLRGLLEGKAGEATIRLVEQSVTSSHRTVGIAVNEYKKVAAEAHSRRVATVRVARELLKKDKKRLSEALAAKYDRKVHLNVLVDPDVLGGVRVEIGDDVFDGTVASRLDEARRRMVG